MQQHTTRNPVVVLGGNLTALGVVRAFGRRGIHVIAIGDGNGIVRFSRYCRRTLAAPQMPLETQTLKKTLNRIGMNQSKRAVVYPTSDLDALRLSELKDELRDDYYFAVGDKEAVETLVDKSRFYKALQREGNIRYPETYFPESVSEAEQIGTTLEYPVFIRPSITQLFSAFVKGGKKGFVAHSFEELVGYYRTMKDLGVHVMFQRIIPGQAEQSYQLEGYITRQHSVYLFARQRLRIYPPDFGNTTICTSIPLERLAEVKMPLITFLAKIQYQGLMSAEFKRDPNNGKLYLLEINARPWWHIWLSARCGVDLLYTSYLDIIGEMSEYTEEYEVGVKSVLLLDDIRSTINALGKAGTTRRNAIGNWFKTMIGRKTFGLISKDDPTPFLMNYVGIGSMLLKQKSQNLRKKYPTENPISICSLRKSH